MTLIEEAIQKYAEGGAEAFDTWLATLSLEDKEELSVQILKEFDIPTDAWEQVSRLVEDITQNLIQGWNRFFKDWTG